MGDKDDDEALEAEFADLTLWLKLKLADKIEKVVLSRRLYDSPAALISGHFGYSPAMKKVMTSQALASNDASANFFLNAKLNLHINPRHPLIKELNARPARTRTTPWRPRWPSSSTTRLPSAPATRST